MSKRVVIVANSCWNIYQFRLNIISKLLDEGWKVFIAAPVDEYIRYRKSFPELKHIAIRKLERKGTNPFKELLLVLELSNIYKRLTPDLVIHYTHKPNIYGGIASRLNNIPSIAIITGLGYAFLHSKLLSRITRSLYRISNTFHKKVIFENNDDHDMFINKALVKASKAVTINGCGVDVSKYSFIEKKEPTQELCRFCFVGRLLYDKGAREFAMAAKRLTLQGLNIECIMIGALDQGNPSMIDKRELLSWVEEGYVRYYGFVEDIRNIYEKSDCIVVPSYREGLSRAILEAMSMGLPVITSDVPGCRQAVDHGINGFLVEPADVESLSKAMESFYFLEMEKRISMGVAGRQKAEKQFNSKKIADELYDIISQVYFYS